MAFNSKVTRKFLAQCTELQKYLKKVKVVLQAEFQMRMELKNLVSSKFQSLVELQRVKNLQRTKAFEN